MQEAGSILNKALKKLEELARRQQQQAE